MRNFIKAFLTISIIFLISCSSSKQLIEMPFSEPEFKTDQSFIRGRGMGVGATKQEAQIVAYSKAREELLSQVRSVVNQRITEIKKIDNDDIVFQQFERNSKVVISEALDSYELLDQMSRTNKKGEIEVWIVIQTARSIINKTINK